MLAVTSYINPQWLTTLSVENQTLLVPKNTLDGNQRFVQSTENQRLNELKILLTSVIFTLFRLLAIVDNYYLLRYLQYCPFSRFINITISFRLRGAGFDSRGRYSSHSRKEWACETICHANNLEICVTWTIVIITRFGFCASELSCIGMSVCGNFHLVLSYISVFNVTIFGDPICVVCCTWFSFTLKDLLLHNIKIVFWHI